MSFEGYYQILCRNGHESSVDCMEDPNFDGPEKREIIGAEYEYPLWRCYSCKELAGWWNLVDVTNGSYYEDERIDGYVELEVNTEPEMCTCQCGHSHAKGNERPTYRMPSDKTLGHIVNGGLNEQKQTSARESEAKKGAGG